MAHPDTGPSAHDIEFSAIDGAPLPMSQFAGKAVLVVNTASECGLTPQYEGLEQLWRDYKDRGLVVLGVPSNDFGAQEPGTEAQIQDFCRTAFGVDFPMTAKQVVKGEGAHPFYRWARGQLGESGEPRWNFHKILVGKDGRAVAGIGSRAEPTSPEVIAAIEAAL